MAHTVLSLDDADPAGDLLLVLETDKDGKPTQSSIRVSSKVLSLASPVFAAMLSPRFAEGQALLTSTSTDTPSISLPDDNSEAMIWLCKALHFTKDLTVDIDFSLLRELAILCDKYELVGALNPWSHAWFRQWSGTPRGADNHVEMLWISYALGNEDTFWHTSRSLMKLYTADDLAALQNERSTAVLPDRLFDSIKNEHEAVLLELHKTLEDIMAPLLRHKCLPVDNRNQKTDSRACDYLAEIGFYFEQFSKSGVWPMTQMLHKTSFMTISDGLSTFKGYWEWNISTGFYSQRCASVQIGIKHLVKKAAEAATEKLKGWCLTCVKSGRYTRDNPDCRASRCKG